MTTEVAIKNDICCVLAADSAITVKNNGETKVFKSGSKLFSLSAKHPVGAMFYNNVSLCRCPLELLIKSYKSKRGNNKQNVLMGYLKDFIQYIGDEVGLTPLNYREEKLSELMAAHMRATNKTIEEKVKKKEAKDNKTALDTFIEKQIKLLEEDCQYHDGFSADDLDDIQQYLKKQYDDIVLAPLKTLLNTEDECCKFIYYLSLIICKQTGLCDDYSGLVFAGYGDDEHFPSIITIKIFGMFKNKVIYSVDNDRSSINERAVSIIPFAQTDEIFGYIKGCDIKMMSFIKSKISSGFDDVSDLLLKNISSEKEEETKGNIHKIKTNLINDVNEYIKENKTNAILNAVDSSSKDEVAKMAEFLINLVVYRHKISLSHETVSEPIDIAVISKHDGFVWVKRKYYFDKEFNDEYKVRKGII